MDANRILKALFKKIGELLQPVFDDIAAERDAMLKRIVALEAEREALKDFTYTGTYRPGASYRRGNFCTHGGSLWHCMSETTTKPGTDEGSGSWQLCAKGSR